MARVSVIISDLTGERIEESELVTVTLSPRDGRKTNVQLDAAWSELKELRDKGRPVARRGRKPRTAVA